MGACHEYALALCGLSLKQIVLLFKNRKKVWRHAKTTLLRDLPLDFIGCIAFSQANSQKHIMFVDMRKRLICEDVGNWQGCREIEEKELTREVRFLSCEELKRILRLFDNESHKDRNTSSLL